MAKKVIQKDKTSANWKKLIHYKLCSYCDEVAAHYHKFKFYCKECYKKMVRK